MEIIVDNLVQVFGEPPGEVVALDRVTHRFPSERISCLLGPSGCGKSTLAQIVGGIEPYTGGTVSVGASNGAIVNDPLGTYSVMVWQHLNLFPWRSVLENVAFGLEMAGVSKRERQERARRLIAMVGLKGFDDRLPMQLSGGMRQRVALARALIMERPIMLMDEPFAALDAQTKIVMQEELMRLFDETKKAVIFVTHSIDEAILLGDRVAVMSARPGRIAHVIDAGFNRSSDPDIVRSPAFVECGENLWQLVKTQANLQSSRSAT